MAVRRRSEQYGGKPVRRCNLSSSAKRWWRPKPPPPKWVGKRSQKKADGTILQSIPEKRSSFILTNELGSLYADWRPLEARCSTVRVDWESIWKDERLIVPDTSQKVVGERGGEKRKEKWDEGRKKKILIHAFLTGSLRLLLQESTESLAIVCLLNAFFSAPSLMSVRQCLAFFILPSMDEVSFLIESFKKEKKKITSFQKKEKSHRCL